MRRATSGGVSEGGPAYCREHLGRRSGRSGAGRSTPPTPAAAGRARGRGTAPRACRRGTPTARAPRPRRAGPPAARPRPSAPAARGPRARASAASNAAAASAVTNRRTVARNAIGGGSAAARRSSSSGDRRDTRSRNRAMRSAGSPRTRSGRVDRRGPGGRRSRCRLGRPGPRQAARAGRPSGARTLGIAPSPSRSRSYRARRPGSLSQSWATLIRLARSRAASSSPGDVRVVALEQGPPRELDRLGRGVDRRPRAGRTGRPPGRARPPSVGAVDCPPVRPASPTRPSRNAVDVLDRAARPAPPSRAR